MAFGRKRKNGTQGEAHTDLRLVRSWHFGASVLAIVARLDLKERSAFDDLLRRLDADPLSHSVPLAGRVPPGQRLSYFGSHALLIIFDPMHEPTGKVWCKDIQKHEL